MKYLLLFCLFVFTAFGETYISGPMPLRGTRDPGDPGPMPSTPADKVVNENLLSLDDIYTAMDAWMIVTYRFDFGLKHKTIDTGIANDSELMGYILSLCMAIGKYDGSRQYGVYHYENNQSGSNSSTHAAKEAIKVLLDTFRTWLDNNPDQKEIYKKLLMSKAKTGIADRKNNVLDYPAFTKVLVERIAPINKVNETLTLDQYKANLVVILESLRLKYFSPEECQKYCQMSIDKKLQKKAQEQRLEVNTKRPNIME